MTSNQDRSQARSRAAAASAQASARSLAEQRVREARESVRVRDQSSTRDFFVAYANSH